MTTSATVLVLGGYGVFGSRVCRRLARDPDLNLLVAGRDAGKAAALVSELAPAAAKAAAFPLDLTLDLETGLAKSGAGIVIHAAGPFQGQDRRVAEACIAQGRHYIDLADGRDFVTGFAALDSAARAAGVLAVSGASSVPALSGAVVEALRPQCIQLERIAGGISPGNHAPRGRALIAGILSFAGQKMKIWRDGKWQSVHGWQNLTRRELPGLGWRWFANCDVPDLTLFPERYPLVRSVTFQAGLELSLLHLGLWVLSGPARAGLLPNLACFTGPALAIAKLTAPFGGNRGGMFVELAGKDAVGRSCRVTWNLTAGSGDGPNIPAIPAVLVARKLARGELKARGAMACLDLFSLEEFLAEVADLDITTQTTVSHEG